MLFREMTIGNSGNHVELSAE